MGPASSPAPLLTSGPQTHPAAYRVTVSGSLHNVDTTITHCDEYNFSPVETKMELMQDYNYNMIVLFLTSSVPASV